MRKFETGATRNLDANKPDYEAILSPLALEEYGKFQLKNRVLPDGSIRPMDNWQLGIPTEQYAKSLLRHAQQFHKLHRGYAAFDETGKPVSIEDSLCAIWFNMQGYLHELARNKMQSLKK